MQRENSYLLFGTNDTERMRIDSSGNVGIGTTNFTAGGSGTQTNTATPTRLVFNNNFSSGFTDSSLKVYLFNDGATRHGFTSGPSFDLQYHSSGHSTNAQHSFYTNNNFVMRIGTGDTTNVGIGTTSPNMKLNISHSDQDGLRFNCADGQETFIDFGDASDNDIGRISYDHADNHMAFRTNNAERMRIDSSGRVGIGNTSPGLKLDVTGDIRASADVIAFSDRKLKKNIKTLDGKKVFDMRGVSFTRIDTNKESSGVIAQEIQKIAPELVNETGDTLGVAYGNLTGYLIEAIKDLKQEIEELKKQIK